MIDKEIREILKERQTVHPEDSNAIEKLWEKEIDILSRDMSETLDFFSNRCTAEEFVWLSEVFEEVQEKTQSDELRECLYSVAKKYPNETKEYNILDFISDKEEA